MNIATSISINGQFIEIDERIVIDLGYKLLASLILPDKIILVLDWRKYAPSDENVKCYGYDGELIWTIDAGNWPEDYGCPASGIGLEDGKLMVYRMCGFDQEIDMNTGKELNCEFTK